MPSPLIRRGPLLSLLGPYHRSLLPLVMRVVDWCVSQLVRLICCRIILTASSHFVSKQSRESVDLRLTCHPSPTLTTFAFRSSEVKRLLLDLDHYGGTDLLGMFVLLRKRITDIMAHGLV